MRIVKAAGKELVTAAPFGFFPFPILFFLNSNFMNTEITVDNMVRRVLFLVREEYAGKLRDLDGDDESEQEEEENNRRGSFRESFSSTEEDEDSKASSDQDSLDGKVSFHHTPSKNLTAIPLTRVDSMSRADGVDPTIQVCYSRELVEIIHLLT